MPDEGSEHASRPSVRLTDAEIWSFVTDAHTGIMTTLRRDGVPIALPMWFAVVGREIWMTTRGRKLGRLEHDPRTSFLVESGERWAELAAVHFTGTAAVTDAGADRLAMIEAEFARKYDAFRTPAGDMPAAISRHHASMRWVRFVPDARVLSWSNAKLFGRR